MRVLIGSAFSSRIRCHLFLGFEIPRVLRVEHRLGGTALGIGSRIGHATARFTLDTIAPDAMSAAVAMIT